MLKYLILFFIALLTQFAHGSIHENFQNVSNNILDELPGNLPFNLPPEKDMESWIKKKCEKNSGPKGYEKVTAAKEEVMKCVMSMFDFETIGEEIRNATPNGNLDSVFKKHCNKTPEFKKCILAFTDELKICLEDAEKKSMAIIMNVTEQLAEFICHKDGDRIALFIAEGGKECLNESQEGISECFQTLYNSYSSTPLNHTFNKDSMNWLNQTVSNHSANWLNQTINNNTVNMLNETLNSLPPLVFEAEQCQSFHQLQRCVVKKLEKCKEPTPANLIDSLLTFIRKATPCSKFNYEADETSSRSKSTVVSSSVLFLSSFLMLWFFWSN